MNLRIIALAFQFLINCWPKSNITNQDIVNLKYMQFNTLKIIFSKETITII